jgi:hypothetical protein
VSWEPVSPLKGSRVYASAGVTRRLPNAHHYPSSTAKTVGESTRRADAVAFALEGGGVEIVGDDFGSGKVWLISG